MLEKTRTEIINGFKIKSYVSETLTEKEHQLLIRKWIEGNVMPNLIKTINRRHTSYGLKHMCENDLGFYVSNYDIKYHMSMLGIQGKNFNESINYCYPISRKWFKSRNKKERNIMMNIKELKELNTKLVKLKEKDTYKFYEVKGIVEWISLTNNKDFK